MHGHPAPAGADLEHVVALADAGQIAHGVVLAPLRVGQRVTRLEHGAGVGHGLVQEGGEQLVRQVVVAGDVGAGAGGRVPLHARLQRLVDAAQPLERPRHQLRQPLGERRQHPDQVVGRPLGRHVGLAEADLAGGGQAVEEGVRPDLHARRARLPAQRLPVRRDHLQPLQPGHGSLEQGARDPGAGRPARRRRDLERGHPTPPCGVWSGRRTRGTPRSHSLMPL